MFPRLAQEARVQGLETPRLAPEGLAIDHNGNLMISKIVVLVAALAVGSISLTACNTIQGAGKDIEKAGEKVQSGAQENKKY
jgi:predicted small secreted protein